MGLRLSHRRHMCVRAAGLDRRQYPRPVLIKGYLTGHEFDLLTLADLFREGEPAVAVDDQGHYLSFSAPDELFHDGGGLYDAASLLLRQVNGVARAREGDFRPVGLTGHFRDEIGQQHHVALADSAEVRGRAFHAVIATSGEQPPAPLPPPPPGPDYIQLAQVHPDVAEALEILGKPDTPPNFGEVVQGARDRLQERHRTPGPQGIPEPQEDGLGPSGAARSVHCLR